MLNCSSEPTPLSWALKLGFPKERPFYINRKRAEGNAKTMSKPVKSSICRPIPASVANLPKLIEMLGCFVARIENG